MPGHLFGSDGSLRRPRRDLGSGPWRVWAHRALASWWASRVRRRPICAA